MFADKGLKRFFSRSGEDLKCAICTKEQFHKILACEQAKSDRNGHCFALVLFEVNDNSDSIPDLIKLLEQQIRITDKIGWLSSNLIGTYLFNSSANGAWNFISNLHKKDEVLLQSFKCKVSAYPVQGGNRPELEFSKKKLLDGTSQLPNYRVANQSYESLLFLMQPDPFWKRVIDFVAAGTGILVFSPILLFTAMLIKFVSPGPVFFKQVRVGYFGNPFTMLKFRTMKVDADTSDHQKLLAELINDTNDEKPMTKLKQDDKIIPFGNFLRKTCIDELPQLINVLKGEMSLIGPRPPIPYEVANYQQWYKGRFLAKPGMTGLWQVSGKNRLTFKQMVRLDIKYARQKQILKDIKILLMTPVVIIEQIWHQ